MASTQELHISNLFSLKGHVCLVTGGGTFPSLGAFLIPFFVCLIDEQLYETKRKLLYSGTGIGLMATQALAANGTYEP